jgi:DNA-nicking Smr family endonuclease
MTPRDARGRWTRRKLSEEERRLWAGIAKSVKPLRPATESAEPSEAEAPSAPPAPPTPKPARPPAPPAPPALAPLPLRERRRLARGSTEIDARLDLHGLTQAEAHAALTRFLVRAQAHGAKFVLVITGKGDDLGRGVLRRQVPLWLALPQFRAQVLGFEAAHVAHGGEGALYVRIRRKRSTGSAD